jgi:TetR/AcrR family transcriptional regulator
MKAPRQATVLTSLTQTHVQPFFTGIRPAWQMLRDAAVAAPIDSDIR